MPAKKTRLLEPARVIETGKLRIGRTTVEGTEAYVAELNERGLKLDAVMDEESGRVGRRRRWVWC